MKLLGFLDLLGAGLLLALVVNFPVPVALKIFIVIYLTGKGFLFIRDIASILDIVGGVVLLLSFWYTIPLWLLITLAAFIGLKGLMSFFT